MFEQPISPAPATPQGAEAAASAAVTPTKEQIAAAIAADPTLLDGVTAKLNVYGKDVDVPYSQLPAKAQLGLAATQKFEEAARIREENERVKAELAKRDDPMQKFVESYQAAQKPAAPVNPLDSLTDPNDIFTNPGLPVSIMRQQAQKIAEMEAKLSEIGQKNETGLASVNERASQMLRQYEMRVDLQQKFEAARAANPSFTASITGVNADGSPVVSYGDNPYVTAVALSKWSSDTPDTVLGGRSGRTMQLAEVVAAVEADNARLVEAGKTARLQKMENERRTAAGGLGSAPVGAAAAFEIPADLRPLATDTPAERAAKAEKVRDMVMQRATSNGVV